LSTATVFLFRVICRRCHGHTAGTGWDSGNSGTDGAVYIRRLPTTSISLDSSRWQRGGV